MAVGANDTHLPNVRRELGTGTCSIHVTVFPLPLSTDARLTGDPCNMQGNTEAGGQVWIRTEAGTEGWDSGVLSRREKLSFPHL